MRVGAVDSPTGQQQSRNYRRRGRVPRWLKALAFVLSILLTAAVVSGVVMGVGYQPVATGGIGAQLAGGIVSRRINDTPPMPGQIYLPAQKAASGTLRVSLTNTGSQAVTILAATLNYPYQGQPADIHALPLHDAGLATYAPTYGRGSGGPLAGLTLQPGEVITITLPVTEAGCWTKSRSYVVVDSFWVRYKFAFWTHLTQVLWTGPRDQSSGAIVTQEPEPASQGGTCLS